MDLLDVRIVDVAVAASLLEQEQRIGVERDGVEIVRILLCESTRCLGPGFVLDAAVREIVVGDVAGRKRIDVGLLARTGVVPEFKRLADRCMGIRRLGRGHRHIQVGPPGPRFAPVADGALRVEFLRFAKRAYGFVLAERVHELKTLVEEGLHFGIVRRDFVGERAEHLRHVGHRLGQHRGESAAGEHWRLRRSRQRSERQEQRRACNRAAPVRHSDHFSLRVCVSRRFDLMVL